MTQPLVDRSLHSANVLICMAGVATAAGPIAGAAAAISGAISLRTLLGRRKSELEPLAETIAAQLRTRIEKNPALSEHQRALQHQMIEACIPPAQVIFDSRTDPEALLAAMVAVLRSRTDQTEYADDGNLNHFRTIVRPVLTQLITDRAFRARLAPMHEAAFWRLEDRVSAVEEQMSFAITDLDALRPWMESHSRETLEGLALRFGHEAPETVGLDKLKAFLISKAGDLKRLEAQIAALEDTTGRITNLKAAAEDAMRGNRLDEAKRLIADALAVQRQDRTLEALRAHAALVEIQAQIALVENDHDEAYKLCRRISESFKPFDLVEAGARSVHYSKVLLLNAVRYGGTGVLHAADMARSGINKELRGVDEVAWARCQGSLAVALKEQGTRSIGNRKVELLRSARRHLLIALKVVDMTEHREDRTRLHNNLSITLQELGACLGGEAGRTFLEEAVGALRTALETTSNEDREGWGLTANNLANTLQELGNLDKRAVGELMLVQSVVWYRASLERLEQHDDLVLSATVRGGLANSLRNLGHRIGGTFGAGLLLMSKDNYFHCLAVCQRESEPAYWALISRNLATAELIASTNPAFQNPLDILASAKSRISDVIAVLEQMEEQQQLYIAKELFADTEARMAKHTSQ